MKAKITATLLTSLKPKEKTYRVHDTLQPGLFIRILPSGHMSYMVTWGRNQARTLGRVRVMTLEQARTEAAQHLADAHIHGEPVVLTKRKIIDTTITLESFLTDSFEPWALAHQRDAKNSCRAIRKSFGKILSLKLQEIDLRRIEILRTEWISNGLTTASANRNINRIRGLLSRAVEWEVIENHPLTKLKRLKIDQRGRVRFLDSQEELALHKALLERESETRAARESANEWRDQRNKERLDSLESVEFVDHLRPMVLLSLFTGMRRGEVFNLKWDDIDFEQKIITVEGLTSKSGQTRHVPINTKLLSILEVWEKQTGGCGVVFPSRSGKRLDNVQKSWAAVLKRAEIKSFRWHDLRHTFASKLVMKGVPLNTLRDLLGHSDIAMTLRYAHLAPSSRSEAVELL